MNSMTKEKTKMRDLTLGMVREIHFPSNSAAPAITPRRVLISMAFHEAGHVAAALLCGTGWVEAKLIKYKRKWEANGPMGNSLISEDAESAMIATAGYQGERIWRLRRLAGAVRVPEHGPSTEDLMIVSAKGADWAEESSRAIDLLDGNEDLVAWLARTLVRRGHIDREYVSKNLPRKFRTPLVMKSLREPS